MDLDLADLRHPSPPRPRLLSLRTCYEKSAHLTMRDRLVARGFKPVMRTKPLAATLHVFSQVPLDQIAFYLNVSREEVARWVRATYKQRPFNWTRWRPELNLYEILNIKVDP